MGVAGADLCHGDNVQRITSSSRSVAAMLSVELDHRAVGLEDGVNSNTENSVPFMLIDCKTIMEVLQLHWK